MRIDLNFLGCIAVLHWWFESTICVPCWTSKSSRMLGAESYMLTYTVSRYLLISVEDCGLWESTSDSYKQQSPKKVNFIVSILHFWNHVKYRSSAIDCCLLCSTPLNKINIVNSPTNIFMLERLHSFLTSQYCSSWNAKWKWIQQGL